MADPNAPNLQPMQNGLNQIVGTFDTLNKNLEKVSADISKLADVGSKSFKKMAKEASTATASTKKLKDAVANVGGSDELDGLLKKFGALKDSGKASTKELNDMSKRFKSITFNYKKFMNSKDAKVKEAGLKTIREGVKKLGQDINKKLDPKAFDSLQSGAAGLGSIFKSLGSKDAKGLKNAAGVTKGFADDISTAGIKMAGMDGAAAKLGGTLLKSVGGALGGISKMFAGPVGFAAVAVKALWDVGMQADSFVKDANKAFAHVRGPDIMTKDVAKQFKEFNNKLFNTARNIEVGLNVEQVREFVNSVYQAGTNMDRLSDGFHNYRDAVYIAAKASKTMGVELPQVGQIMGELINEFRMDLDKTDGMFTQIAFDAKKAGISSDRFWNAIENASASLAMYGTFLKGASDSMTAFSKTGMLSAKDTAGAVADLGQAFTKMTEEQRASFIGLAGTGNVRKLFGKVADEMKGQAADITGQVTFLEAKRQQGITSGKAPAGSDEEKDLVDQIERLRNQEGKADAQMIMAQRAMAGNMVDMAPYLPMLSDKVLELTGGILKNSGFKGGWASIGQRNLITAEKILESQGIDNKLAAEMANMALQTSKTIDNQLGYSEEGAKVDNSVLGALYDLDKTSKDTLKGENLKAGFKKLADAVDASGDVDSNEIITIEENMADRIAKVLKVDKSTARTMVQTYKMGKQQTTYENKHGIKNYRLLLEEMMNGEQSANSLGTLNKQLTERAKEEGIKDKMFTKLQSVQKDTTTDMAKSAESTFKQSVKQTLSFKEMQDIAGQEVQWRLYNLKALTGIQEVAFGIFKGMMKHFKESEPRTTESQLAEADLKKSYGADVSKLLNVKDAKGALAVANELKIQQGRIADWSKQVKQLTYSQNALKDAQKDNDPSKALQENIDALEAQAQATKNAGGDTSDLEGSIKKLTDMQTKMKGMSSKDQKTFMASQLSDLDTAKAQNEEQIKQATAIVNGIAALNSVNKDILKYQIEADPQGLADDVEDMVKQGDNLDDIVAKTGQQPVEIAKALQKTGKWDTMNKDVTRGGVMISLQSDPTTAKYLENLPKKATMQTPEMVTAPGPVTLHPGEMILPKEATEFKTKPLMPAGEAPAGGAGGGAPSKQITIQVNATEKDLAQRIANEVRGVMYREQLNGQG